MKHNDLISQKQFGGQMRYMQDTDLGAQSDILK